LGESAVEDFPFSPFGKGGGRGILLIFKRLKCYWFYNFRNMKLPLFCDCTREKEGLRPESVGAVRELPLPRQAQQELFHFLFFGFRKDRLLMEIGYHPGFGSSGAVHVFHPGIVYRDPG